MDQESAQLTAVTNRAEVINQACRDIAALESERGEIGEQIREIKQKRIKGDLGMKISDFNVALRLYQIEGEDRMAFFDTLRETFRALGVGEQLNWIAAADAA